MNENVKKNEEYLKTGLHFMGFTPDLYPALEKSIKEGKPEFTLNEPRQFNNKAFNYSLHYGPSKDPRYPYEWTGYDISLKDNPQHKIHVKVDNNRGITAKEAANLLSGLAVGKTNRVAGTERETWTILDFSKKDDIGNFLMKNFGVNYGFDINAAVKELTPYINDGKGLSGNDLVDLRKGNLPDITYTENGKTESAFLVANPEKREICVYNDSGKLLKSVQGISAQQQERAERMARAPKKADFIQNNLLNKIPRNTAPALAEMGEETKKSRRR